MSGHGARYVKDEVAMMRVMKSVNDVPVALEFASSSSGQWPPKAKKLLIIFPLSRLFFLDIVATRFYTFFNCNVTIAESMQPIEKGE